MTTSASVQEPKLERGTRRQAGRDLGPVTYVSYFSVAARADFALEVALRRATCARCETSPPKEDHPKREASSSAATAAAVVNAAITPHMDAGGLATHRPRLLAAAMAHCSDQSSRT